MFFRPLLLAVLAATLSNAHVVTETHTVTVCYEPSASQLPSSRASSVPYSLSSSAGQAGSSGNSGKPSSSSGSSSGISQNTSSGKPSSTTLVTISGPSSSLSNSGSSSSAHNSGSSSSAYNSGSSSSAYSASSSVRTSSIWSNSTSSTTSRTSSVYSTGASSGFSSFYTSSTGTSAGSSSSYTSSTSKLNSTTSTSLTSSTASSVSTSSTYGLNSTSSTSLISSTARANSTSTTISSSSTSSVATNSTTSSSCAATATPTGFVNQTTCNGNTYTYQRLEGYGFNPSNARDQYGDTIGGIGSAIALDRTQWRKLANGSYTGVLWALPDRGWNTEGTLNFQPRVHKFNILFTPQPCATVSNPSSPNLIFTYDHSILFYGPDGTTPTTGLDADGSGHYSYPGFPDLPITTYSGDGFGNPGPVHQRIPLDTEGIVLMPDGTFWISDEYGPYVYHFDTAGKMLTAIRPNDAIIPMRNGSESFSADSPFYYINNGTGDDVNPADNPTGRDNNHGFEGLTVSADGQTLYVLLQAATNQEGGLNKQTERYTRFVQYDISVPTSPSYVAEYVVPLPLYNDPTAKASKNPKTAAQSEILHINGNQFFVLARDSGAGHGQSVSLSVYRHADVFDITGATNIAASPLQYDCTNCSVASSSGVLKSTITPATYCSFLDFNVNSELNRFGVHNGGNQDQALLNEKWESLAIVPVDGLNGDDGEWFLFSVSDNDFITQDGYLEGGQFQYKDSSGFNLDVQALVFRVKLPSATVAP